MTNSPADELRADATHLRTLAEAAATATGTDIWTTRPRWPDDLTSNSVALLAGAKPLVHGGDRSGRGPFVIDTVGDYITAMGPALGLALAGVLDRWAWLGATDPDTLHRVGGPEILAVARLINASDRHTAKD